MKTHIRLAGMGGQGIIFAGMVLARAASLYERAGGRELFAIQTQSYGPAARGESSKSDVVVSDAPIFFPFVERPDYLVLMSQPAYEMFIHDVGPGTVVILDEDGVEGRPKITYFHIPAIRRAEEIGCPGGANMIMLGALAQISGVVSIEAVVKAMTDMGPIGRLEENERALQEGVLQGKAFQAEDEGNI